VTAGLREGENNRGGVWSLFSSLSDYLSSCLPMYVSFAISMVLALAEEGKVGG